MGLKTWGNQLSGADIFQDDDCAPFVSSRRFCLQMPGLRASASCFKPSEQAETTLFLLLDDSNYCGGGGAGVWSLLFFFTLHMLNYSFVTINDSLTLCLCFHHSGGLLATTHNMRIGSNGALFPLRRRVDC